MKNSIFKFNARWLMAVIAMVTIGVGQIWATDATFDYTSSALWSTWGITAPSSAGNGVGLDPDDDYTVGVVTMNITHGDYNTRVWNYKGSLEFRFYNNSTVTFSVPSGYKINSITFSTISDLSVSSPTGGSWSTNTWSPALETAPTSVELSASATVKMTNIVVAYESTGLSVTYDGNGKSSGTVPTDATLYTSGATVTVKANTGSLARTGCTFAGWNTAADGSGTNYAASGSATFSISANTTLYAKWTATVVWKSDGYTLRTDADQVIPAAGKSITPPTVPTPGEAHSCGNKFMGWTTTENYSGNNPPAVLVNGAQTITGDVTYYAVWADYAE